jgi:S1-C subfamily serine protease
MIFKVRLLLIIMFFTTICLGQRQTEYTETSFKSELLNKGFDNLEGIYEETKNLSKYGIIKDKDSDRYSVVYLNSSTKQFWKEGTIKGYLYKTATEGLLRAEWFIFSSFDDKQNFYMELSSLGIKEIKSWTGAENLIYVKMFPSSNDISTKKSQLGSGTGFAISPNGIIVTNYHVIEGAKSIKIRGVNLDFYKTYNAKVLVLDKNNDLALIQIDDQNFTSLGTIPFTIKTNLTGVGESIFVLGYPLRATMGDEIKLTNGIVSSKTGFQGDITSYQISAPIQPGNSGGPLFDNNGNLIGIINAKHIGAENASYGVKSSYLTSLIELLSNPLKVQTVNLLNGKSLTQQVELVKRFVYIIETE